MKKSTQRRHCKNQETPLLKIFYTARSRKLTDDLYHVGLSVSNDQVLELSCANRASFIIASFLVFLEKISSVYGLKIILLLTQKQISTNQVTMGLVHL